MKSLFGEDESAAALFTYAMLATMIAGDAAISRRRRLKTQLLRSLRLCVKLFT